MEATPKVHRQRHRRMESRHRRANEHQSNNITEATTATTTTNDITTPANDAHQTTIVPQHSEDTVIVEDVACPTAEAATIIASVTSQTNSSEGTAGIASQSSQQTVLLVNGHAPPPLEQDEEHDETSVTAATETSGGSTEICSGEANRKEATVPQLESPTQQTAGGSSRNSSGDALSLRETLQQLAPTVGTHRHHRRTHSPQSPARRTQEADASFHRGILGFMDRELKQSSPTPSALSASGGSGNSANCGGAARKLQSLSDPQASPAQRSIRSRSSLEKSPRRKRSKSESRRRRERKLIAAGEMEVRQANETLMRYLKQCTEVNDASLSGELEIDQNFDERRVHRKTKSQRDKRGHLISKLYSAGGLSSILKELSDDILPAEGEEIYNPFTPVVSPTEDTPAHIEKMFMQTSSGYRPVESCYFKHSFMGTHLGESGAGNASVGSSSHTNAGGGVPSGAALRASHSYGDTRCLLDPECCSRHTINTNIQLACVAQRIWLLIANICHGLLAGLALAHLLFVLSSHPMDWSTVVKHISLAGETSAQKESNEDPRDDSSGGADGAATLSLATGDVYAAFAEIYLNSFYCLAIVCLVSVFDRMDICRWDLSNATELVSFRWLIIAMIYIATIILTICSDSLDERLYLNTHANVTLTQNELISNSVRSIWSSLSLTRSIFAICGWIMIGLTPHEDLLYEHLVDLTKYQLTNN